MSMCGYMAKVFVRRRIATQGTKEFCLFSHDDCDNYSLSATDDTCSYLSAFSDKAHGQTSLAPSNSYEDLISVPSSQLDETSMSMLSQLTSSTTSDNSTWTNSSESQSTSALPEGSKLDGSEASTCAPLLTPAQAKSAAASEKVLWLSTGGAQRSATHYPVENLTVANTAALLSKNTTNHTSSPTPGVRASGMRRRTQAASCESLSDVASAAFETLDTEPSNFCFRLYIVGRLACGETITAAAEKPPCAVRCRFRWQRLVQGEDGNLVAVRIPHVHSPQYVLTEKDIGCRLRVTAYVTSVDGSDERGNSSASSSSSIPQVSPHLQVSAISARVLPGNAAAVTTKPRSKSSGKPPSFEQLGQSGPVSPGNRKSKSLRIAATLSQAVLESEEYGDDADRGGRPSLISPTSAEVGSTEPDPSQLESGSESVVRTQLQFAQRANASLTSSEAQEVEAAPTGLTARGRSDPELSTKAVGIGAGEEDVVHQKPSISDSATTLQFAQAYKVGQMSAAGSLESTEGSQQRSERASQQDYVTRDTGPETLQLAVVGDNRVGCYLVAQGKMSARKAKCRFQWTRLGRDAKGNTTKARVKGANAPRYKICEADIGHWLRVKAALVLPDGTLGRAVVATTRHPVKAAPEVVIE
ncbi:hypothetical protein CYMTET_33299 [Cymbomonas tetramitiformis]|uniref:Uncharacterized protein n=1 Tax=Cymbomonas tetramitiformis TaxID=36881 RepID=A0AAE0FDT2_9CHLO|nr:hypothetical protein CYMTET_33299 [Cymbomonas tetramitiformis]